MTMAMEHCDDTVWNIVMTRILVLETWGLAHGEKASGLVSRETSHTHTHTQQPTRTLGRFPLLSQAATQTYFNVKGSCSEAWLSRLSVGRWPAAFTQITLELCLSLMRKQCGNKDHPDEITQIEAIYSEPALARQLVPSLAFGRDSKAD